MNGATNAPEAPSTCTGTSSPVRSCRSSSAAQISWIGSYAPSNVEPRMATTPIVFSSQSFTASSAESVKRLPSIGTRRISTSQ